MKQYVSVFILMLQSIRNKLILILGVMVVAECILFGLNTRKYLWIEDIITHSRFGLLFCIALMLLTVILSTSMSGPSRQSYTLHRLALSSRTVFCIQAMVNLTALLLLWAVQLMTALLLCRIYLSHQLASADHSLDFCEQSVFLLFYRKHFLHNIFPMESILRWMRNIALILALAFISAEGACKSKNSGKIPVTPLVIAALVILLIHTEIVTGNTIYTELTFIFLAVSWTLNSLRLTKDGPYMDQDSTGNAGYCNSEEPAATPEELEVMR